MTRLISVLRDFNAGHWVGIVLAFLAIWAELSTTGAGATWAMLSVAAILLGFSAARARTSDQDHSN